MITAADYDRKTDAYRLRLTALERQRAEHRANGRRDLAERLSVSIDSLEACIAFHAWKADELRQEGTSARG